MSPALPVISGDQAVAAFQKLGYRVVRRRGSHARLRNELRPQCRPISIPMHKELDRGLLRALIRTAGISVDEFMRLL